jgi:hypothetical protein
MKGQVQFKLDVACFPRQQSLGPVSAIEEACLKRKRRGEGKTIKFLTWDKKDALHIDFKEKKIWIPDECNKSDQDQWMPLHPDLLRS